ncbi:hypothetical protein [Acinetobacter baumannii]|uniref:hypothetical protein n=1 Tax=Acinetobacter baumannii TaxID=470 RepID=UPI00237FD45B|nr:hypothetical protein [Acinetobacter baumannii]MDE3319593.1 hypothetical protein [Acinetobacter baumannii]MDX5549696.1 hypothetical protein [Acinetobacter baumannii]HEN9572427.1 hypothetical protein [Acinetobacter baumannii]
MKKIVLALLLACTGTSAYSESVYELAQAHCKKAETIASTAQTYRQLGMKASEATAKLMSVTAKMTDQEAREKEEKQIFFIVQDAYTIPVYPDQTMKKKAIADFEERHYLACSQSFQNKINSETKSVLLSDGTINLE